MKNPPISKNAYMCTAQDLRSASDGSHKREGVYLYILYIRNIYNVYFCRDNLNPLFV